MSRTIYAVVSYGGEFNVRVLFEEEKDAKAHADELREVEGGEFHVEEFPFYASGEQPKGVEVFYYEVHISGNRGDVLFSSGYRVVVWPDEDQESAPGLVPRVELLPFIDKSAWVVRTNALSEEAARKAVDDVVVRKQAEIRKLNPPEEKD
jgi:hypothetical protein